MARIKTSLQPAAEGEKRKGWSKDRIDLFLAALRQTANVSAACRASGITTTAAYKRRSEEPGFRAAWNDALCEGYATLEQLLLSQAIAGLEPEGGAEPPIAPSRMKISERTVLSLLAHHRQTVRDLRAVQNAEAGVTGEQDADARAEIEATLGMIHERMAAGEAEDAAGAAADGDAA